MCNCTSGPKLSRVDKVPVPGATWKKPLSTFHFASPLPDFHFVRSLPSKSTIASFGAVPALS
jgi:hypothetical protein